MTTYTIEFSHGGWYDGLGGIEHKRSRAFEYSETQLKEAREDCEWLNKASFLRDMFSVKKEVSDDAPKVAIS